MSSVILKYFMKRLKEIRLQSTMTANAVAEHFGILYRTYQKYETGEIDPPLSKAIVLADLFDAITMTRCPLRIEVKPSTCGISTAFSAFKVLLFKKLLKSAIKGIEQCRRSARSRQVFSAFPCNDTWRFNADRFRKLALR